MKRSSHSISRSGMVRTWNVQRRNAMPAPAAAEATRPPTSETSRPGGLGAAPLRDVVVSGAFRKVGGPPGGGYGLIVRDAGPAPRDGLNQGGRYYVLAAGDRGEVGIWRRDGDRWVDLLPWTRSDAVRPDGAANELMARAIGPRLTLMVNGTEVASLADAALAEGGWGSSWAAISTKSCSS